ncbi:hypothetical protein EON66_03045 [archaeon]|nr:MAG: hypothetical protein EON66_03045 [archaeon]
MRRIPSHKTDEAAGRAAHTSGTSAVIDMVPSQDASPTSPVAFGGALALDASDVGSPTEFELEVFQTSPVHGNDEASTASVAAPPPIVAEPRPSGGRSSSRSFSALKSDAPSLRSVSIMRNPLATTATVPSLTTSSAAVGSAGAAAAASASPSGVAATTAQPQPRRVAWSVQAEEGGSPATSAGNTTAPAATRAVGVPAVRASRCSCACCGACTCCVWCVAGCRNAAVRIWTPVRSLGVALLGAITASEQERRKLLLDVPHGSWRERATLWLLHPIVPVFINLCFVLNMAAIMVEVCHHHLRWHGVHGGSCCVHASTAACSALLLSLCMQLSNQVDKVDVTDIVSQMSSVQDALLVVFAVSRA